MFFNAFWLIPHFCINLMYMRDTMHQIDSGVIISFLKAILRKIKECVEIPLNIAGAAADKLTSRLRTLPGRKKTASGHLLYRAHACLDSLVPVNYAITNIFNWRRGKEQHAVRVPATMFQVLKTWNQLNYPLAAIYHLWIFKTSQSKSEMHASLPRGRAVR